MPILAPETHILPADLLAEGDAQSLPGHWHILHTKPNQAKAVARLLVAGDVPFYLPLAKQRNIIRGREQFSHKPVLGNYLFLCDRRLERGAQADDQNREVRLAQMTNRVAHVLPVADQQLLHDTSPTRECW